jgi:hypothetical protein
VQPALQEQRVYSRAREGNRGGEAGGPRADHDHLGFVYMGFHYESFHQTICRMKARYHFTGRFVQ